MNSKNLKNDETDIDIEISKDKKKNNFWGKVSGIWQKKDNGDVKPSLPFPSQPPTENTSRTISSNHTFQGQLKGPDLAGKGHNFDTTEVEMGKLGLHQVAHSNHPQELPKSYSNVDNATLTGLKIDMRKGGFFEELTRTKLNIFSALKKIKNKEDIEVEKPSGVSENTQVHNSDGTVHLAMPKAGKWKEVSKILGAALVLGGVLLGILYGVGKWHEVKEKAGAMVDQNQNKDATRENAQGSSPTAVDQNQLNQTINYQTVGRGLIFGCKNNTWACVDKNNYVLCRSQAKRGSKECYSKGVLKTNDSCFKYRDQFTTKKVRPEYCN